MSNDNSNQDPVQALKTMTRLYLAERIVRGLFPAANTDDSVIQFTRQALVNVIAEGVRAGWEFKKQNQGAARIETIEDTRQEFEAKLISFEGREN